MTRIYIAGPMTGLPDFNFPAFHEAAAKLRALGHEVQNPAENPEPPCKSWLAYMRMAIVQVASVDAVALLPGWEHSPGAKVEEQLALGLGLRVAPIECFLAGDDTVVPPITYGNATPTEPYRTPVWDVREGGNTHKQYRSRGF